MKHLPLHLLPLQHLHQSPPQHQHLLLKPLLLLPLALLPWLLALLLPLPAPHPQRLAQWTPPKVPWALPKTLLVPLKMQLVQLATQPKKLLTLPKMQCLRSNLLTC